MPVPQTAIERNETELVHGEHVDTQEPLQQPRELARVAASNWRTKSAAREKSTLAIALASKPRSRSAGR